MKPRPNNALRRHFGRLETLSLQQLQARLVQMVMKEAKLKENLAKDEAKAETPQEKGRVYRIGYRPWKKEMMLLQRLIRRKKMQ